MSLNICSCLLAFGYSYVIFLFKFLPTSLLSCLHFSCGLIDALYRFWIWALCQLCLLQMSSPTLGSLFSVLPLEEQKFLILIQHHLSIISFIVCAFWLLLRNLCLSSGHKDSLLNIFSMVYFLPFIFKSIIHLEVIFMAGVRQESGFELQEPP